MRENITMTTVAKQQHQQQQYIAGDIVDVRKMNKPTMYIETCIAVEHAVSVTTANNIANDL